MKNNPLRALEFLGQSVWLDYLGRGAIKSGQLQQLIEQDGLSGVTSNPDIFEKAIGESHDYDAAIKELTKEGKSVEEIYQALTVEDIQMAADLFRPTYDRTQGADGYVFSVTDVDNFRRIIFLEQQKTGRRKIVYMQEFPPRLPGSPHGQRLVTSSFRFVCLAQKRSQHV